MYFFCDQCGAQLVQSPYGLDPHECVFEQLLLFQTQCARIELEKGLEAQVAAWACEPRLANRVAFSRYVREHRGGRVPRREVA